MLSRAVEREGGFLAAAWGGAAARCFASAAAPRKLVFFGAPGVGKGTFASRVAPVLGVPTISTGDIIRAEIKAQSELGTEFKVRGTGGTWHARAATKC